MHTTDAIVLNIKDFGEFDQLVSLYTKKFGKLQAKVRSSKKITSRQANFLHTPSVIKCSLVLGKQGYILSGVINKVSFGKVFSDIFALGYTLSFFNLVDSIIFDNQKDNKIWELLKQALQDSENLAHEQDKRNLWAKEKEWILQLLEILGFGGKIDTSKIHSQKQLDYHLKHILENKLEQSVIFFGLNTNYD
ncbi:MAG: DNA repair protein RecO [Candidatus Spechtbacteria bacterium RIFCSPLOWO2_02_FULL_38_8]|uniref:DNA repair protein RecO n=1 Tax=Candidatus Spechtbacteria bacterium RIFCSPLOWO2_02_FULL_38_8 TaxID=1802164 RepID=A0A1G2HHQ3_9BACT|nr:MAG: DNA repair protein RecO [Candidatus Spechtbacteria bacterium RIFCSPLOWO2_02_FULL_38_8]